MQLGEKIKLLRKVRGLTYRQLGEQARVDHAWLYRLERGQGHNLSLEAGKRLALALGVTLDYLAGMDEERTLRASRPLSPLQELSCEPGAPGHE